MKFETRAIHAGQAPDAATGSVIVPVYQTSTFAQEDIGVHKGYEYSRSGNPTRAALESALASLEGAKHGLAFASGLAASTAVLQLLRPGDHVISSDDLYGGTYRLFEQVLKPLGITTSFVPIEELAAIGKHLRDTTRMVWIESPTNPLLQVANIKAIAEQAHAKGVKLVVDNTFATPFLQNPLALGADVVVHSTTKYIAGHSDIIGGAVLTSDGELYERLKFYQNAAGAVPGVWDSWLVLRGLKTLAVRMRQHQANAQRIAEFLEAHPAIERVFYPGLPSHPDYGLASEQMRGSSGMVSIRIGGGIAEVKAFLAKYPSRKPWRHRVVGFLPGPDDARFNSKGGAAAKGH